MIRQLLATETSRLQQLLRLLGHREADRLAADARMELEWTNLPTGLAALAGIAVLLALVYGVFWLYRREAASCPMWAKWLLATLRAAVALLLVIVFLGPALIYVRYRTVQPSLVLARDASQSMNTADRYADDQAAAAAAAVLGKTVEQIRAAHPTRVQLVNQILQQKDGAWLTELATKGKLELLDFSDHVARQTTRQGAAPAGTNTNVALTPDKTATAAPVTVAPLVAEGRASDLAVAIRESLSADAPAAIVLISDGQHTASDDARAAAREAKQRGVPLFVLGMGDPSRPKNLKASGLYVRPQVWQDEPFEIEAVVSAQSLDAESVRVELLEQRVSDSDGALGGEVAVQTQSVAIPAGSGRIPVQFSQTVKEAGRFVYTVKVEKLADELIEEDNQATSTIVKVLSREKVRVLLVAGSPTWEFRLVQKLFARDKTLTVSCWLQTLDEERAQEGTRQITKLPATKDELFWYDMVLLFDPNPQEFDREWIELLKQFVGEHSGGLLFMAGPKYAGSMLTGSRTLELQKLLPVSFGDVGALEVASLLTTNQRAWPLKVVSANADHPVMRFFPDRQESQRRWESLPGIYWSFPCDKPKPTAQVLLEHTDPVLRGVEGSRPLLVSGRYGSGHTLYLGFNGTWRWRRAGHQAEFFDKFWIQSIRYLMEARSLEGGRRGSLQTDKDRYEIGQRATITARLQDAAYNPLVLPKVEVSLQVGGDTAETLNLSPVPNQPGTYEFAMLARKTGLHTLRLRTATGGDAEGALLETSFPVEMPSVETSQVWLDKPLLKDLAELSGGRYFEMDQSAALLAAIPNKTETIEVRGKPEPLWDVRGMLIALVGLLTIEWFVRKRFQLY